MRVGWGWTSPMYRAVGRALAWLTGWDCFECGRQLVELGVLALVLEPFLLLALGQEWWWVTFINLPLWAWPAWRVDRRLIQEAAARGPADVVDRRLVRVAAANRRSVVIMSVFVGIGNAPQPLLLLGLFLTACGTDTALDGFGGRRSAARRALERLTPGRSPRLATVS